MPWGASCLGLPASAVGGSRRRLDGIRILALSPIWFLARFFAGQEG